MNSATAKRIAAVIEELSRLHPDWRVGQMVANVALWAKGPTETAVWDVEDEEFLQAAEEHIQAHSARVG
jgi:hypothetical protein